jgi:hypothetical protein
VLFNSKRSLHPIEFFTRAIEPSPGTSPFHRTELVIDANIRVSFIFDGSIGVFLCWLQIGHARLLIDRAGLCTPQDYSTTCAVVMVASIAQHELCFVISFIRAIARRALGCAYCGSRTRAVRTLAIADTL